jgi:hypothetical protein
VLAQNQLVATNSNKVAATDSRVVVAMDWEKAKQMPSDWAAAIISEAGTFDTDDPIQETGDGRGVVSRMRRIGKDKTVNCRREHSGGRAQYSTFDKDDPSNGLDDDNWMLEDGQF